MKILIPVIILWVVTGIVMKILADYIASIVLRRMKEQDSDPNPDRFDYLLSKRTFLTETRDYLLSMIYGPLMVIAVYIAVGLLKTVTHLVPPPVKEFDQLDKLGKSKGSE